MRPAVIVFSFNQYRVFLSLKLVAILFAISVSSVQAQTTVRVSTALGNFDIELFDSTAPVTVANFLSYVNSGRFNGTFIHRSEPGFVIQGGWLSYNQTSNSLNEIQVDAPIVNEFNISNTRGTVAMAKLGGNPNSATSQWFVNLADNPGLDSNNGGFTVFGTVIGDGMDTVDAIARLPAQKVINGLDFQVPLVNYAGGALATENFVNLSIAVLESPTSSALNRFDDSSNQLILSVDAGSAGIFQIAFSIETQDPQVIVRALPTSLIPKTTVEAGFSTFNEPTGQLTIPELEVGGQVAYRNLILSLTDSAQLLFTLQSFVTP